MFVKGVMLCELGLLRSAIQLFWGKEKMKAVQLLKNYAGVKIPGGT